jgi:Resolvase, N terminal domain
VLIVVKLDLVGRNTRDVLNLVHEMEEKGASLRVLEPAIDTGGPKGRMVLTVLGMVAEMELRFIRDRQRAGIDAAKAKGVYKGRPVTFDRARIVALRKEGMGATEIARAVGCKRGNVYKTLGCGVQLVRQERCPARVRGRLSTKHSRERSPAEIFLRKRTKAPHPSPCQVQRRGPSDLGMQLRQLQSRCDGLTQNIPSPDDW